MAACKKYVEVLVMGAQRHAIATHTSTHTLTHTLAKGYGSKPLNKMFERSFIEV